MTYDEAKAIVSRVLHTGGVANRIGPLLEEYTRLTARGNLDQARETARTIDDLAGYRDDGRWVGAAEITAAFQRCGTYGLAPEWATR